MRRMGGHRWPFCRFRDQSRPHGAIAGHERLGIAAIAPGRHGVHER
jgi:hypothetical protein